MNGCGRSGDQVWMPAPAAMSSGELRRSTRIDHSGVNHGRGGSLLRCQVLSNIHELWLSCSSLGETESNSHGTLPRRWTCESRRQWEHKWSEPNGVAGGHRHGPAGSVGVDRRGWPTHWCSIDRTAPSLADTTWGSGQTHRPNIVQRYGFLAIAGTKSQCLAPPHVWPMSDHSGTTADIRTMGQHGET